METNRQFEVRVRGIIIDQNEILLVSHVGKEDWLVLPGGHLEWGEDLVAGLCRELFEELGIEPEVGLLQYVHTFIVGQRHVVEFFYSIQNASAYRVERATRPTHAHELAKCQWVPLATAITARPDFIAADIESGKIASGAPIAYYHRVLS